MLQAILEFLKKAATKAGALGKAAVKEAVAHPYKTLLKTTPAGQALSLYDAFQGMTAPKPGVADVEGVGQVTAAPADYYKSPQAQALPPKGEVTSAGTVGGGGGMGGAGQGILNRNIIPAQYQQFQRQPGMTIAPQTMPMSSIPEQYRGMAQPVAPVNYSQSPQAQIPNPYADIGAGRGFLNETFGIPQPQGLAEAPRGRQLAYYAGGLIPKIVMTKLGQPSSAEATTREATNAYYNALGMQNPEEEGIKRIAVDMNGKPVPIGTPGSVVMDVKPTRGGKSLSPAAKPDKLTDIGQFRSHLQEAGEVLDKGAEPEAVRKWLEDRYGDKLEEIDDWLFERMSRKTKKSK